jgi:hypothetical protein
MQRTTIVLTMAFDACTFGLACAVIAIADAACISCHSSHQKR